MDVYYIAPAEDNLTQAMREYTQWLDHQIAKMLASIDPFVDPVIKKWKIIFKKTTIAYIYEY
jgi:hypothetical protein